MTHSSSIYTLGLRAKKKRKTDQSFMCVNTNPEEDVWNGANTNKAQKNSKGEREMKVPTREERKL